MLTGLLTYRVTDKSSVEKFHIDARPTPYYIYAIVIGALLLAGGAWVVYCLLGGSVEISVEEKRVTYVRTSMSGKIRKQFTATAAELIDVRTEVIKKFMSRSTEIVFETADGDFVTSFPMLDGDAKRAMAGEIQQTLREPGGGYGSKNRSDFIALIGIAILGVGALRAFHALQVIIVTGRHDIGYLQIRRRLFLLPFISLGRQEIELSDYRGIEIKENPPSCNVLIKQKKGDPIPVATDAVFTLEGGGQLSQLIDNWVHQRQAKNSLP